MESPFQVQYIKYISVVYYQYGFSIKVYSNYTDDILQLYCNNTELSYEFK
jgi:hypothetical protein